VETLTKGKGLKSAKVGLLGAAAAPWAVGVPPLATDAKEGGDEAADDPKVADLGGIRDLLGATIWAGWPNVAGGVLGS